MLTSALRLEPKFWNPKAAPSLRGAYAANERLARAELWSTPGAGPEDVVFDRHGRLVTGLVTGEILTLPKGGGTPSLLAHTGGRPLGIERDEDGVIVCDAHRGLLHVDEKGRVRTLTAGYEGVPFRFTNNGAVATDGTIYFSDSSTKYRVEDYRLDILEHRPRGRLFAYDRRTQETRLLIEGLYFANGVALSSDESFLVVAELSAYRLRRLWLKGPRAGQHEIFVDNLPGFPDNVSSNGRGTFWVALPSPRNPVLDGLMPLPPVRRAVVAMPEHWQPQPPRFGFVLGIDEQGKVVANLQDSSGRLANLTSAREHDGFLYLGSLTETAIAVLGIESGR